MMNQDALNTLTREQLMELLILDAKNFVAMDGTWFQSVERKFGMDEAMFHDAEAWRRYTGSEARRLKQFLQLPEHPGLEGLARVLPLRINERQNACELLWKDGKLIYHVVTCRVQQARLRKGMPLHPCKPVGEIEYSGFAAEIDERIGCKCLSCCPEVTDDTCACSWEFSLQEE